LLSIEIPWNSDFLLGIRRNPQELMEEGKDLRQTGHMSHDHLTNPSLNTGKGNTSNFSNPTRTPYKVIMPPPKKGNNAAQKVHAIMAGLDKEDLKEAKVAFIECLDSDSEPAEEPNDF